MGTRKAPRSGRTSRADRSAPVLWSFTLQGWRASGGGCAHAPTGPTGHSGKQIHSGWQIAVHRKVDSKHTPDKSVCKRHGGVPAPRPKEFEDKRKLRRGLHQCQCGTQQE